MDRGATGEDVERVVAAAERLGLKAHPIPGAQRTAVGITGNKGAVTSAVFEALPGVLEVIRVSHPYKLVSREFHPEDTIVSVGGVPVGGTRIVVIAGPCAVESLEQTVTIAREVKARGADLLRGGAFKPRTSPYAFQGLGEEGLRILAAARDATGLPVVTEVLDTARVDRRRGGWHRRRGAQQSRRGALGRSASAHARHVQRADEPDSSHRDGGWENGMSGAVLVLEDGRCFSGRAVGAPGTAFGEVVFNTGMSGYQETLTDPSYRGQIVVMTAAQVGNYGLNDEDVESSRIQVAGFAARHFPDRFSNQRGEEPIGQGLAEGDVVGIDELDARALVRHLRSRGVMRGAISTETASDADAAALVDEVKEQT